MAKVYMTDRITPESLVHIYEAMGISLPGRVAVKISTGEPGGHNFLQPDLIKDLVHRLKGTIVECNTAYEGRRNTTQAHWQTIHDHGFAAIAPCDILDEDGDMAIPVNGGYHLHENYVGSHLADYDSMLMLSHFKGHAMGGFGGALKNMSIGLASSRGKIWIHTSASSERFEDVFTADHDSFLESMADADKSVMDFVGLFTLMWQTGFLWTATAMPILMIRKWAISVFSHPRTLFHWTRRVWMQCTIPWIQARPR